MKNIELWNKVQIPYIGYGTWKQKDSILTKENVLYAINNGYKLIDTAEHYGNEKSIGKAIKESNKKREDIFITSKLWVNSREYNEVLKSFNETLKRLDTDYLDLYLIHWPANQTQFKNYREINKNTWKAFEKLYKDGKVKAIGVSNFTYKYLKELIEDCEIKPMVNQIEYHPGFTQSETVELCFKNNIQVQSWSPLGHGDILNNKILNAISNKYNKTTAQIIIRWIIQNKIIPLPKSSNKDRIIENLNIEDFKISNEDMKIINELEFCGGLALDPDKFI